MLILTLRTDKPEAEIGLFDDDRMLVHEVWHAHRQLAETIHGKIRDIVTGQGKDLNDLGGVVVYHGPGSFTGLRIGVSVANALAASYGLPMIGTTGDDWQTGGVRDLLAGVHTTSIIFPEYGAPVHITQQKH